MDTFKCYKNYKIKVVFKIILPKHEVNLKYEICVALGPASLI